MRQIVLTIAALGISAGVAVAQDQSGQQNSPSARTPSAQRGPQNPAIKSTDQNNSSTPVAGANSFTEAQAKSRIEARGYTNVSGLKKDASGVWRGRATLNGQTGPVSLDYQGNVN